MSSFDKALAAAVAHHQAGRLRAAEEIYRAVLAIDPDQPDALHLLGVIAGQAGDHQAAVACFRRVVQLRPDVAQVHHNLGKALLDLGSFQEAIVHGRRAVRLDPNCAAAYNNLGAALRQQGRLDEAIQCHRHALELEPDLADARNNLGIALKEQGKPDEAVACFRRALELQPNLVGAQNNLGIALADQGRFDDAVTSFRRAVELQGGCVNSPLPKGEGNLANSPSAPMLHAGLAESCSHLAAALQNVGKLDEAAECYRRVLELKPDAADTLSNLGVVLQGLGRLDEAAECYRRALELQPDFDDALWNQSLFWLRLGEFHKGWPEIERQRPRRDGLCQRFQQPKWDGGSLAGKTILLHAEQGLGDTIHFVRYAWLIKRPETTVILECQKTLLPLLAHVPVDRLVAQGEPLPPFDVFAPLISLPAIFETTFRNVPAEVPYLFASPSLVTHWRQRLAPLGGFKIGIAWQGNPKFCQDRCRSIPLECFSPLAQTPGVCLISLQKSEVGRSQLAQVRDRFAVIDWADELDETSGAFMDTAAVMKNLDLVVTSDTSIAHLAGALGVPVWVALPLVPEWRWSFARSDSPWYPTMRLFRQKTWGAWPPVFDEMAIQLGRLVPAAR